MKRLHKFHAIFGMLALCLGACSAQAAGPAPGDVIPLQGMLGAYAVRSASEIDDMHASGFQFALIANKSELVQRMTSLDMVYITASPEWYMYQKCFTEAQFTGKCNNDLQADIYQFFGKFIKSHTNDKALIGYWILDDDPMFDARDLINKFHSLVWIENAHAAVKKYTICGFHSVHLLYNYTASGCDAIAIYVYPGANQNSPKDWGMSNTLPKILAGLKSLGWDPKKAPLIGMPQTFYFSDGLYAQPSYDDIYKQSVAYCQSGATALMPYAWDDGHKAKSRQLYNTPAYVKAMQDAKVACSSIWAGSNK